MGLLNRGKVSVHPGHDYTLLLLEVPRTNDKKELAAEQMLASLHGILRSKKELRRSSSLQEHISLEVAAIGQRLRFYIWAPKQLQAFVEGQIYAQYPTVQIYEQEEDYSGVSEHKPYWTLTRMSSAFSSPRTDSVSLSLGASVF